MERARKVNPDCVNASNPFHQCAEYCSPRAAGADPRGPALRSAQNGVRSKDEEGQGSSRRKVDPLCANASNPFHQCAEYCSPRTPEGGRPNGREKSAQYGVRSKEEEGNGSSRRKVDPSCLNASKEEEGNGSSRRKVDPLCVNASKEEEGNGSSSRKVDPLCVNASKEEEGNGSSRRKVDPLCVNASNPFHQCAEYCSPRTPEAGRPNGRERSVANGVPIVKNGKVDPTCVNASNPFHVCAEYCSQKRNENSHIKGTKSGSSTPHGSNRSFKFVERDDVHPNCPNASNPFHKCADYCVQKMNGTV